MPPLILASTSPARKQLLERLQVPFTIMPPHVDETSLPNESAYQLTARLAKAKAEAIAKQVGEGLIIGCDQVITLDEEIFGKPGGHQQAVSQLKKMSGKRVISWSGLCLLNAKTQQLQLTVEQYYVYFRPLTTETIEQYLQRDKPYQCAGSIKAEGIAAALFERFEGDDPAALLGLPLIKLARFLENENFNILAT
jgi:septum formation protein